MNHLGLAVAVFAASAAAQVQLARFDFQNQLSSVQSTYAWVPDLSLTQPYQYSGPSGDRALALQQGWSTGGQFDFTVFPNYGQTVDFSHLRWFVRPNALGVADYVSGVTITANGLPIAVLNSIAQNTVIDIDLTTIPALQHDQLPVNFVFSFVGNPAGTSTHEISYLEVTGNACDLDIFSVSPPTLPTATTDYFQVLGTGFLDLATGQSKVVQVKFGGTLLSPFTGIYGVGSYEIFSQWKLRVRPPQCIPAGTYPIEVTTQCGTETVQVALTDPAGPTITGETLFPAGGTQCISVHGGPPGPKVVVIFITPLNTPSVWPGLLDLQIGGGFSEIDTRWFFGDCGTFCFRILPTKVGEYHYHQGVVWLASNPGLTQPLLTTPVLSTYLY